MPRARQAFFYGSAAGTRIGIGAIVEVARSGITARWADFFAFGLRPPLFTVQGRGGRGGLGIGSLFGLGWLLRLFC